MNTVFSFSAKKESELELVNNLKQRSKKTGVSFSYLVTRALINTYEQNGNLKDNK